MESTSNVSYYDIFQATNNDFPGMVYFASAGFTAIAIVFCALINVRLKGRKVTNLTKDIEPSYGFGKHGCKNGGRFTGDWPNANRNASGISHM